MIYLKEKTVGIPNTELEMGASEEDSDGSKWSYFRYIFF